MSDIMHGYLYYTVVLGLTLAALVLSLWWVRRTTRHHVEKGEGMEVLQQFALSQRERIVCIRVHGVKLLLASTPQGLSTLHVFAAEPPTPPCTPGVPFSCDKSSS
ncbi:FliO/MopB family protein [Legionella geestiana]|nr:flagellar biosynthetic protein FliO [Legionella geestiana]